MPNGERYQLVVSTGSICRGGTGYTLCWAYFLRISGISQTAYGAAGQGPISGVQAHRKPLLLAPDSAGGR